MHRISSTERPRRRPASADSGFTLIELIAVMVLVGVLGAVVAMFGSPLRAGVEGQRRAELADAADTAYRRMARDIRRAVPNSIHQIDTQTIEFIPSKDGGRYAYDEAGDTGNSISFSSAADVDFDVVGSSTMYTAINPGDFIVIGNWGYGAVPDAYCPSAPVCNRAEVASFASPTVTLVAPNPFPGPGATISPPGQRFQLVDKDEQAVTFRCNAGKLTRYWNYGWGSAYTTGSSAVLASNVASCDFVYAPYQSQTWGLFRLEITMQHADLPGDAQVKLFYQLHVNNTP